MSKLVLTTCLSGAVLWLSFPLVTLSTKCLLTKAPCTRWGPTEGADMGHPITAAALHLLLVGLALLCWISLWKRKGHHHCHPEQEETLRQTLTSCLPVGLAFGIKYVCGHAALQHTPAAVFELFHCTHMLWIALVAHCVLREERLTTWGEVAGCVGIVAGSVIMASQKNALVESKSTATSHDNEHNEIMADDNDGDDDKGMALPLILLLNVLNGVLAGAVLVLLRSTLLRRQQQQQQQQQQQNSITGGCARGVTKVTAYKMLIGAAVLLPVAVLTDGPPTLTRKQVFWLCLGSLAMMMYHVNLSLLCWLATAPSVGVMESLRPVPAFVMIALVQKMPKETVWFWVGSGVILCSAVGFELSRRLFCDGRSNSDIAELQKQNVLLQHHGRLSPSSSESTETTHLTEGV